MDVRVTLSIKRGDVEKVGGIPKEDSGAKKELGTTKEGDESFEIGRISELYLQFLMEFKKQVY